MSHKGSQKGREFEKGTVEQVSKVRDTTLSRKNKHIGEGGEKVRLSGSGR